MATKTISGSYTSGFYLSPTYQTLDITSTGFVSGFGVATTATQPSTINNLGTVTGAVILADGGSITNGSSTNTSALIVAIDVKNASAAIANYAVIATIALEAGGSVTNGSSTNSTAAINEVVATNKGATVTNFGTIAKGIKLNAGGVINNHSTGKITDGISVAGAVKSIINDGSVAGATTNKGADTTYHGLSVDLLVSGSVINGKGDHAALLSNGVKISGFGNVTNDGTIGSAFTEQKTYYGGEYNNSYVQTILTYDTSIVLTNGGQVTNGSSSDVAAAINSGISISGSAGTVVNYGVIGSPGSSTYSNLGRNSQTSNYSIVLAQGGTVTNGAPSSTAASISNGISISGKGGTVINYGSIGAPGSKVQIKNGASVINRSYSIVFAAGGAVTNGAATSAAATISNGVSVSGGAGTITNFGAIGGPSSTTYYGFHIVGYSIKLNAGGSVTNGAAISTSAGIKNGISISGGAGTFFNFGSIGGLVTQSKYYAYYSAGYSIALQAGGSVTNGSATSKKADISNGISVSGALGTVTNFATIDATSVPKVGGKIGVDLGAGGTVVNGSASDPTALIAGTTGLKLSGKSGTVTNYGTIKGSGGTAISFGASSDKLIEEGSGVLIGNVDGGGGALELGALAGPGKLAGLGGAIVKFAEVTIDKGASWTLTGASTIAAATALYDLGSLTNTGALDLRANTVNNGTFDNVAGAKLLLDGDVSVAPFPASNPGAFNNAGLVEKLNGVGDSVIATGSAKLQDTGTIDVEKGTLELTGAAMTVAGLIEGPGAFEFGGGAATLASGARLSVAKWSILAGSVTVAENLAYGGTFAEASGSTLNVLAGDTLTLTGTTSLSGSVSRTGTLSIAGGATTLKSGATLSLAKLSESGSGTNVTVAETLAYAGAFTEGSGSTLNILAGDTLTLTGTTSLGGSVTRTGTLSLAGGSTTIASGAALSVANWSVSGATTKVTFGANLTYAGKFNEGAGSTLSLTGGYLALTGAATFAGGTVNGSQRLYAKGTTAISGLTIGGTVVFENTKSVIQSGGNVTVGDSGVGAAVLFNIAGATYAIADNSGIGRGTAVGSRIANSGLFEKTGGTGTSTILPAVQNIGTIEATSGTLDLKGVITGTGSLTVAGAAKLEADAAVGAGQTAKFTGASEELILKDAGGFAGKISGFGAHDTLDFGAPFTAGTVIGFTENAAHTQGVLTLTDGSAHASVTLLGSYIAADFHATSGAGGTLVTYAVPAGQH